MSAHSHWTRFLKRAARPIAADWLPPAVVRLLSRKKAPIGPQETHELLIATLIRPAGLCFDIGANIGQRVEAFRGQGFRVIAVEPQDACFSLLASRFRTDPGVKLVKKAAGKTSGRAMMMISDTNTLSTLSKDFIAATKQSGRFQGITWSKNQEVEVTTLDELIAQYGVPDFVKIDVEGFEQEVIQGLSRPISLMSIEWVPELTNVTLGCIDHLSRLGCASFNLSWLESGRLSSQRWSTREEITEILHLFRSETYLFADLYIRFEQTNS
jgi:FkbM family methyltransferase